MRVKQRETGMETKDPCKVYEENENNMMLSEGAEVCSEYNSECSDNASENPSGAAEQPQNEEDIRRDEIFNI